MCRWSYLYKNNLPNYVLGPSRKAWDVNGQQSIWDRWSDNYFTPKVASEPELLRGQETSSLTHLPFELPKLPESLFLGDSPSAQWYLRKCDIGSRTPVPLGRPSRSHQDVRGPVLPVASWAGGSLPGWREPPCQSPSPGWPPNTPSKAFKALFTRVRWPRPSGHRDHWAFSEALSKGVDWIGSLRRYRRSRTQPDPSLRSPSASFVSSPVNWNTYLPRSECGGW